MLVFSSHFYVSESDVSPPHSFSALEIASFVFSTRVCTVLQMLDPGAVWRPSHVRRLSVYGPIWGHRTTRASHRLILVGSQSLRWHGRLCSRPLSLHEVSFFHILHLCIF
ncbi:hypothetical protein HGRIS_011942 [Hohenbuehelia grisea]|uniref:Uncharacterized protein n=1 Tax=Hohenbuehelia grisea TaxID=104357 RepID=A0ABR3JWT4_9AGAR